MLKNLLVAAFIILIIASGLGYAIYSAPELPEHQLFNKTLEEFAKNAGKLEQEFKKLGQLTEFAQQLDVPFKTQQKESANILVKTHISNNTLILTYDQGKTALANQTIILEPYLLEGRVRWKCINGSVLIRFRSKNCRLGKGIDTSAIVK